LTYAVGCYFLPRVWALNAAGLTALSPHLVVCSGYLLTETLFAFVLLLAILLFFRAMKRWKQMDWLLSGGCFGYAYLVNQTILFIPWALVVVAGFAVGKTSAEWTTYFKRSGLFLGMFSILWLGWGIRNAVVLPDDARRSSGRALATLVHGTYPDFIYKSKRYENFPYHEDPEYGEFSQSPQNFARIFVRRFRERPLAYLMWYFVKKPYYIWSWNIRQGQGDIFIYPVAQSIYSTYWVPAQLRNLMKILHPLILVLALAGMLFAARQVLRVWSAALRLMPWPIFIVIIYCTAVYTIFASWPRYSIPFRPLLYLAAIYTLSLIPMRKTKLTARVINTWR
jgi:4-amino-4-deoxy-L-arabinose transferase-like glycosyltransferase